MSAGCDPALVLDLCERRGMSQARAEETAELVQWLVAGYYDGTRYSSKDEPQMPGKKAGEKPPDNLPEEEMVDPLRVIRRAFAALDPLLAPWKAGYAAETVPAADLIVRLGMELGDWFPQATMSSICERLAGRPLQPAGYPIVPAYFEPELSQAAAEAIVERFRV